VNLNYAIMKAGRSGFFHVDASLFYTYFTNKIVGDFNSEPDKIIYANLDGHAISKGITLTTEVTLLSNLKFIGGVTLMDVYQVEPDANGEDQKIPQLFAPSFSGTWSLSYSFIRPGITIDLTGKTNGPMALPVQRQFGDTRRERSPWFSLVNIQVSKILDSGLELYGGAKNILNFIPDDPLLNPQAPFSEGFDTTYNYAPIQGLKGFVGVRYTFQ